MMAEDQKKKKEKKEELKTKEGKEENICAFMFPNVWSI